MTDTEHRDPEGPADGGAGVHDGGADGGAGVHDGGADGGADTGADQNEDIVGPESGGTDFDVVDGE